MKTVKLLDLLIIIVSATIIASCSGENKQAGLATDDSNSVKHAASATDDSTDVDGQRLFLSWSPATGIYSLTTHMIDFSRLEGSRKNIIYIVKRSDCTDIEQVDIGSIFKYLKISGTGANRTFAFYTPSQPNPSGYTTHPIGLLPDTSDPRNCLGLVYNERSPGSTGNPTHKWIGSEDTRNDYTNESSGFEYSIPNTTTARYLGFKKDDTNNDLIVKWKTSLITQNAYNYQVKTACEDVTKNLDEVSTCAFYVCPN